MIATLLQLAAAEEHHGNVALETLPYGIVAAVVFTLLAMVTLSYRNVANRHSAKAEAFAAANPRDAHGSGH